MPSFTWDDKAEYLMRTRKAMFNDDYLAFLVERVWEIAKPVRIADFGCGTGFLGMKLLPLLPAGSSYLGVDRSGPLLEEARNHFSGSPFDVSFLQADITQWEPEPGSFDVAACQAVLLHLEDPAVMLQKMARAVRPGGMVLAVEPHWNGSMASIHVDELDMLRAVDLGFLQRLYESDRRRTGKDGNIGLKLPVYLRRAGLKDVQSRLSDAISYLHPGLPEDKKKTLYGVLEADGYTTPPRDREGMVSRLTGRGAAEAEAHAEFDREAYLAEELRDHGLEYDTVFAYHMILAWGYRP